MTKEEIIKCVEIIKFVKKYGTDHVQIDYPSFLNTEVHGYNKSRYVASWINQGGTIDREHYKDFRNFLLTIPFSDGNMSEDEADDICNFATDGKMEFEDHAKKCLKKR